MLNLIKNEYAKIFHKKSTYFLLGFLIVIIALIPISSVIMDKMYYSEIYVGDIDDEISWAKENEDVTQLEFLTKVKELNLDYYSYQLDDSDWQVSALNNICWDCWYYVNDPYAKDELTLTDEEISIYNQFYEDALESIKNNDWKSYEKLNLDFIAKTDSTDSNAYKAQKYIYDYRIQNDISPDSEDELNNILVRLSQQYEIYLDMLDSKNQGENYDKETFEKYEKEVLVDIYCLDTKTTDTIVDNTDPYDTTTPYIVNSKLYNNLDNCTYALMIVLIISIVIAGNIFAKEFSQGTIKFLLINPVKRSKIFWSKFITVISYAMLLTFGTFILEFILSSIFCLGNGIDANYITVIDGAIKTTPAFLFILKNCTLYFLEILVAIVIAFALSAFFRNSALSISLSLTTYFIGSVVCQLAILLNLDFIRFTIFACMDLNAVIRETTGLLNLTPGFAIGVIAVHIFLLMLTAYDAFTKKNI